MSAVDDLIKRLESIDRAVSKLADPTLEAELACHIQRGVAVHGLVCIEAFLRERMHEWVSMLAAARISPAQLPGGRTRYETRMLEVLVRKLRDADNSKAEIRSALIDDTSRSLNSLRSSTFVPHYLGFMWMGSNVQVSDIESIVAVVSAIAPDKVWARLTGIWQSVDKFVPHTTSLRFVFNQIADMRHSAAHDADFAVPVPNLQTLTRNVKLVCLCIDIAVTFSLHDLSHASLPYKTPGSRRLIPAKSCWRECEPGKKNAFKRHTDLEAAIREACVRAASSRQVLLVMDSSENVLDWRIPL